MKINGNIRPQSFLLINSKLNHRISLECEQQHIRANLRATVEISVNFAASLEIALLRASFPRFLRQVKSNRLGNAIFLS